MACKTWFEVLGVQVCYNCFLYLLPVIHTTDAQTNNTRGSQSGQAPDEDDEGDMVKGLAAGFGFFFGMIVLICVVWCFCCTNVCSKEKVQDKRLRRKVSPSPPHSASVRTRSSTAGSP